MCVCVWIERETCVCVLFHTFTINEAGFQHMLCKLLSLVLVLSIPLSRAVHLHLEQQNLRECPGGFDTDSALQNATLYAQVYTWMHNHDVVDWNYAYQEMRVDPTNAKRYPLISFLTYYGEDEGQRRWTAAGNGTDCALVSYKTEVESPSIFARLMRNLHMFVHFPIEVHKSVCLLNETVVETATLTIPLIHEMAMTARYAIEGGVINTTIDASYNVPWYIDFLIQDVSHHLLANFKEKIDAVAKSLCGPVPPFLGLVSPEHMYLRSKWNGPPSHPLPSPSPSPGTHAGYNRRHANPNHPRGLWLDQ